MVIVEPTSGNTGTGLAQAAVVRGLSYVIVTTTSRLTVMAVRVRECGPSAAGSAPSQRIGSRRTSSESNTATPSSAVAHNRTVAVRPSVARPVGLTIR
jgi:hypothetical protein